MFSELSYAVLKNVVDINDPEMKNSVNHWLTLCMCICWRTVPSMKNTSLKVGFRQQHISPQNEQRYISSEM